MSNLNLEYFKEFYKSGEFEKGLKTYFPSIQYANSGGFPQILQVSRHFNKDVSMPFSSLLDGNGMEKSICFSIIFYYVCLCDFVLYKIGGKELLKDFLKSTGWPLVYCGLGGIMSPNHTMQEADLVFVKASANQQEAIKLFHEVEPFMRSELNDFFQGNAPSINPEAYHKFIEEIKPKIPEFWTMAEKEIKTFTF